MGCCFRKPSNFDDIEFSNTVNSAVTSKCGLTGSNLQVSFDDSTNTYRIKGNGVGTVIGSCPLDCDTARWEILVVKAKGVQIGVKRYIKKQSNDLNKNLSSTKNDSDCPSWLLENTELKDGDVVGIYWDQTDLPMLSFTVNGNEIFNASINRIRPSTDIFPAVSLENNSECTLIFDETQFKYPSKSSKFKMIICSTSII